MCARVPAALMAGVMLMAAAGCEPVRVAKPGPDETTEVPEAVRRLLVG